NAMDMFEAFASIDAKALKQRKDNQRCQSLRRWRRIVEDTRLRLNAERLIDHRAMAFQIGSRHGAVDAFEIGRDLASNIATIKIVESGMGELAEGRGKRCLLQPRADLGDFAVEQKCVLEANGFVHFRKLFGG